MPAKSTDAICVETKHFGEIQWMIAEEAEKHDINYGFKVTDAVRKAFLEEAKKAPSESLTENSDYRCQCEGFGIIGRDLNEVAVVTRKIAATLSRFKHVIPLTDYR